MNFWASAVAHPKLARQRVGPHSIDQAEVDGLGGPALLGSDQLGSHAEDEGGRGAVDILAAGERLLEGRVFGEVREHPQFDLRIVGREQDVMPGSATNARRTSRPSSVRTGMFCRLGSEEERRPVAATAWLKRV